MANRLRICAGSFFFTLAFVLSTCRVGVGESCLADSDCDMGLLCLKRVMEIDDNRYEEHFGQCQRDQDDDGIANDGDGSGDETDNRCGVWVEITGDSQTQVIVEEVIGNCDDNCPDVANQKTGVRFDCLAKDDCCPISAENKELAKQDQRCSELTSDVDTCSACFADTSPTCYLSLASGYDLDQEGCIRCRPLQNKIDCTGKISQGKWSDTCSELVTQGLLPKPACSGTWRCTGEVGTCRFTPELFKIKDEDGYNTHYQLDSDGDGVGDECDNCPFTPNGINCDQTDSVEHCDVNQDGTTTQAELLTSDQKNRDGDEYGDACDRCPDKADKNNQDLDSDGLGNPCDADDDGDGICDPQQQPDNTCTGSDNCPLVSNEDQSDLDQDGLGDLCDSDQDGDGVREDGDGSGVAGDNPCRGGAKRNCDDNCPRTKNADQRDDNNDAVGDDCE